MALSVATQGPLLVREIGGEVDVGDYIVGHIDIDRAPFEAGNLYVMFLQRNPRTGDYHVAWGPRGVFDITGPYVVPLTPGASEWLTHRDTGAFVAALRSGGD